LFSYKTKSIGESYEILHFPGLYINPVIIETLWKFKSIKKCVINNSAFIYKNKSEYQNKVSD